MIAELDGEPVAFMMAFPDINELTPTSTAGCSRSTGSSCCGGCAIRGRGGLRVPLMGVAQKLHDSRLASQLAFMMIEYIRRAAVANYGASTARSAGSSRTIRGWCRSPSCPARDQPPLTGFTKERALSPKAASSTQVGAWSLAFSSPRAHLSTPAPRSRSAASGEHSR